MGYKLLKVLGICMKSCLVIIVGQLLVFLFFLVRLGLQLVRRGYNAWLTYRIMGSRGSIRSKLIPMIICLIMLISLAPTSDAQTLTEWDQFVLEDPKVGLRSAHVVNVNSTTAYACWEASGTLRFAYTEDRAQTWTKHNASGVGNATANDALGVYRNACKIILQDDGTINIVFTFANSTDPNELAISRSTDRENWTVSIYPHVNSNLDNGADIDVAKVNETHFLVAERWTDRADTTKLRQTIALVTFDGDRVRNKVVKGTGDNIARSRVTLSPDGSESYALFVEQSPGQQAHVLRSADLWDTWTTQDASVDAPLTDTWNDESADIHMPRDEWILFMGRGGIGDPNDWHILLNKNSATSGNWDSALQIDGTLASETLESFFTGQGTVQFGVSHSGRDAFDIWESSDDGGNWTNIGRFTSTDRDDAVVGFISKFDVNTYQFTINELDTDGTNNRLASYSSELIEADTEVGGFTNLQEIRVGFTFNDPVIWARDHGETPNFVNRLVRLDKGLNTTSDLNPCEEGDDTRSSGPGSIFGLAVTTDDLPVYPCITKGNTRVLVLGNSVGQVSDFTKTECSGTNTVITARTGNRIATINNGFDCVDEVNIINPLQARLESWEVSDVSANNGNKSWVGWSGPDGTKIKADFFGPTLMPKQASINCDSFQLYDDKFYCAIHSTDTIRRYRVNEGTSPTLLTSGTMDTDDIHSMRVSKDGRYLISRSTAGVAIHNATTLTQLEAFSASGINSLDMDGLNNYIYAVQDTDILRFPVFNVTVSNGGDNPDGTENPEVTEEPFQDETTSFEDEEEQIGITDPNNPLNPEGIGGALGIGGTGGGFILAAFLIGGLAIGVWSTTESGPMGVVGAFMGLLIAWPLGWIPSWVIMFVFMLMAFIFSFRFTRGND